VSRGCQVFFLARGLPQWLETIGVSRGVKIAHLSTKQDWDTSSEVESWLCATVENDGIETAAKVRDLDLDILWLDHYSVDAPWIARVKELRIKIGQIADQPALDGVDVVLDYGFDASEEKHSKEAAQLKRKLLLGTDYALLPKDLARQDARTGMVSREPEGVLVALGSGSNLELVESLIQEHVRDSRGFDLHVLGASRLTTYSRGSKRETPYLQAGLSPLLKVASFAITGGGVAMYERIANGVPGIALQTAENQKASLDGLKSMDLLQGETAELSEIDAKWLLDMALRNLKWPKDEGKELVRKSLVDFFGADRVAYSTGSMVGGALTCRAFSDQDSALLYKWTTDDQVRSNSISSKRITPREHLLWIEGLKAKGTNILIFERFGIPCGQVRFEKGPKGRLVLSYSIDRLFRGLGLGLEILSSTLNQLEEDTEVEATVKRSNGASLLTLLRAGFTQQNQDDSNAFLTFRKC